MPTLAISGKDQRMRSPSSPTFRYLAKVHTFRFFTMIAAWVLILCAFLYHPEWIRASLRLLTHAVESLADQVPEPWGSRVEIMLRELGGIIWVQITVAIVLLRLILWVPFHLWRLRKERTQSDLEDE
jgi:hypothetical protein